MNLTINTPTSESQFNIKSIDDLKEKLTAVKLEEMAEVWLEKDKGASLALYKNKTRAGLMFINEDGNQSFISINPEGSENEEIEIFMLHGQNDTKPARYLVNIDTAINAMIYFWENEEMDPEISWKSDKS